MSNIHIGFVDQHRCSSRILKPPGGGYSDIFGTDKPVEARNSRGIAPDRTNLSPPFHVEKQKPSEAAAKQIEEASKEDHNDDLEPKEINKESNGHETGDEEVKKLAESVDSMSVTITKSESESKEVKEKTEVNGNGEAAQNSRDTVKDVIDGGSPVANPAATPRKRVPPGGYSSGLW